jgi:AsmA protein
LKKLLIGLGVIIVLLVAAILIIPAFIPIDTIKEQIASQVREQTGREFTINGEVSVSLLPNVALEVNDVVFGNAPGGRAAEMASLKTLEIDVKLFPLISGELAVNRFILIDPVINLEALPDGTANWQIGGVGAAPADDSGGSGAPGLEKLQLGDVRLENGRITYFDAKTGTEQVLSDVNLSLDLKSIDAPFSADGSMVWQGEKIELSIRADTLNEVLQGGSTGTELKVAAAPINLDFKGSLTGGDAAGVAGEVALNVPSVRKMLAWTGNPMPDGKGFELLDIKGKLAASAGKASFSDAAIAFDAIKGKGELAVDSSGAVPSVVGRLDLEQLDVNPYMPPAAAEEESAAGPSEWSDDPIDFSALRTANADFTLTAEGIKAQNIKIGRSALTIKLAGGKLVADLTELALYGGNGKGRITLDASGKVAAVKEEMSLNGIQAEPLLADAVGTDRLSGTGSLNFNLTASGASQRQMVKTLNGNGAFDFRDGALKGINLAAMVRNVSTAFLGGEQEEQKTDFSELSATFTIKNGILSNNDLKMASPLFRVTGAGTADIPARTTDYTVTPKLVASTEGQGGTEGLAGISVPVIVSGPWHDLSYRPDLAGAIGDPAELAKGAAGAVEGIVEGGAGTVEGIVEGAGGGVVEGGTGAIKSLLGGGGTTAPATATEGGTATEETSPTIVDDASKAVKGLFGD